MTCEACGHPMSEHTTVGCWVEHSGETFCGCPVTCD